MAPLLTFSSGWSNGYQSTKPLPWKYTCRRATGAGAPPFLASSFGNEGLGRRPMAETRTFTISTGRVGNEWPKRASYIASKRLRTACTFCAVIDSPSTGVGSVHCWPA